MLAIAPVEPATTTGQAGELLARVRKVSRADAVMKTAKQTARRAAERRL
jgi:hypothetical protein